MACFQIEFEFYRALKSYLKIWVLLVPLIKNQLLEAGMHVLLPPEKRMRLEDV